MPENVVCPPFPFKTLRVTPAMEAKIDDHAWSMEEVVMMADTMP